MFGIAGTLKVPSSVIRLFCVYSAKGCGAQVTSHQSSFINNLSLCDKAAQHTISASPGMNED